jgi:hypothetical protein
VEEVVEETPAHTQEAPKHLFRKAKDAVYIPPAEKNVGIKDKTTPTITKKPKPAYRTLPPIHNPAIVVNVLKRSMEAPITIMQKELWKLQSLSCKRNYYHYDQRYVLKYVTALRPARFQRKL